MAGEVKVVTAQMIRNFNPTGGRAPAMTSTTIEWTERSWNPIVGCTIVSPGCTNCYAMRQAARIERMNPGLDHYRGLTQPSKAGPVWTGRVALAPEHILTEPLRRRKPTTYFVNSMGDLFHESVPDEWIDQVFAVMALAPQHTFQVLTKRARRMRTYFANRRDFTGRASVAGHMNIMQSRRDCGPGFDHVWPLPNVWLGVSAEDQTRADERIPDLLATPAAIRFVSAEPLLGPVDLTRISWGDDFIWGETDALAGIDTCLEFPGEPKPSRGSLDWIVVGGESGPGARVWPGFEDACRSLRDQCRSAGVAFFMKQMAGPVKARMPAIPDDLMIREMPDAR